MVTKRTTDKREQPQRQAKTAFTIEGRENQLVALAVDTAEKQMRDGTASAQVISHYLKLGSTRERLEQDRLARENELLQAKVEAMQSAKRIEELYEAAISAMRAYAGHDDEGEEYYDED